MQNNTFRLILAFIAVFLITNGTFYALCEKDIILDYINKFGDWTNALLWHSSKAFLYYAAADTFYNIRYIAPKLAYALAPVKWADKLNGWLGGDTLGELERHLAQDKYNPLYKDALNGLHSNVGVPLYNNFWQPCLSFFGIKSSNTEAVRIERVTEYVDRTINTVTYVPVVNPQQMAEVQTVIADGKQLAIDLKYNLQVELSKIRQDWQKFLSRSNLTNQVGEDLSFLTEFLSSDFVSSHCYSFKRVGFSGINKTPLSQITDSTILDSVISKFNIYTSQITEQRVIPGKPTLVAYYSDLLNDGGSLIICNISNIFTNDNEFLGIQIPHAHLNTNGGLRLLEFLRNSSSSQGNVLMYNPESNNIIIKGFLAVSELNPESLFDETNAHISALSSHLVQASVAFTSLAGLVTGMVESTQGIVHAIDLINNFNSSIQNTEMGAAIASVFMHYGQPLPEVLQHYASQPAVLPNPQDYLLAGEQLLEPNTPTMVNNAPNSGGSIFPYVGIGLAFIGTIGITWYLTKYGMDASPAVETAKSLKETLRERYTNFK